MIIGYARVSSKEQKLDLQIDALRQHDCELIFTEKISSGKERPELKKTLSHLRADDVFIYCMAVRPNRTVSQ